MYRLTNSNTVLRLSDNAHIPADERNRDYRAYQEWLKEGNTPEPAPIPPVVIPQVISRFQAFAALELAGQYASAKALIEHPDTPVLAKLAWESAQEFRRQSPLIATLGATLGLSEEDIDVLFVAGAQIEA